MNIYLSIIDPFNNKKITFSECVSILSMEIIDNNNNEDKKNINNDIKNNKNQVSLLDKICLEN